MAGYISKNAANRWDNMAHIVSGGGAGSTFVSGLYREPGCRAGVYPAIAGEAIAAGATGNVVYQGRVYEATNQSGCNMHAGNRVALCISPTCEHFFIGCPSVPVVDCCDRYLFLCVNGDTQAYNLLLSNRVAFWAWDSCCDDCLDAFGRKAEMYLVFGFTCDEATDTITYAWQLYCTTNAPVQELDRGSGTFTGWCLDSDWVAEVEIYPSCPITITASMKIGVGTSRGCGLVCDDGSPPPPKPKPECCEQLLWFCINGDSQQLAVDGGSYTWDVSACCLGCTTATLEIRIHCSRRGILVQWFYICDGGAEESGVENFKMSSFCTSSDPQIIDIDASCFIQMQVSIVDLGCDVCGITTDCCDPVPVSLQMVVVGGTCPGTYTLLWDAGQTWLGTAGACGDVELVCTGGAWVMSINMLGTTLISEVCDPFELVFDGTLAGAPSITVTPV